MGSDNERPVSGEEKRPGCSAVAWVDVRTHSDSGPDMDPLPAAHLLDQVSKAVRGDDRVCPVATSMVAVEFGSVASAVPLLVLGNRIARAVGPPLHHSEGGPGAAVGMAGPVDGIGPVDPDDVSRRSFGAARSGRSVLAVDAPGGFRELTAAISVDEWVTGHSSPSGSRPSFQPLHRRTIVRYCAPRAVSMSGMRPTDLETKVTGPSGTSPSTGNLTVLVVDPMATAGPAPGFALSGSVTFVQRLGCHTATATVSPDEPLVTTVDGAEVDLVVLVLDGAWVGRSPNWETGAWGLPARLTTAYVDKGIPVLAVSAGIPLST